MTEEISECTHLIMQDLRVSTQFGGIKWLCRLP